MTSVQAGEPIYFLSCRGVGKYKRSTYQWPVDLKAYLE